MINRILLIIALVILILAFSSCQDSLGIDPNVQKNPIINDPGNGNDPGDVDSPIYEIRDKQWYFAESVFLQGNHTQNFEWYNNVKYQRNSCQIDTSKEDFNLWIDLDAECTYPDAVISNRSDRVTGFQLAIDSLVFHQNILKIERRDMRNLIGMKFRVYLKDLRTGKATFYTNDQLIYSYMFEIDRTREIISFNMIIWLLYMQLQDLAYDTEALQVKADFHYGQ
jgi:hypothetical protein